MVTYYKVDGTVVTDNTTKFSTNELCKMFDGWFTLRYVKTIGSTDYWLAMKDLCRTEQRDYPPLNERATKEYGAQLGKIYGDILVAPSTVF